MRVGYADFPPFVSKKGARLVGFEAALWEAVARELGVASRFSRHTLGELLSRIRGGTLDVAFAGISKTEAREREVDFTHATYSSGLAILVRSAGRFRILRALGTLLVEKRRTIGEVVLWLGGFVAAVSHAVWFVERGKGSFSADYLTGIGDAVWYTVVTISTVGYGDFAPVTLVGRTIGVVTIVIGYAVFALLIAELNSLLVLERLRSPIQDAGDRRRRRVATVGGTVAETLLEKYQAVPVPAAGFREALALLARGDADALVFDAPILQHYVKEHGTGTFRLVGPRFEEHEYGIALPEGSPWREKINRALLRLAESGEYDRLQRAWFA